MLESLDEGCDLGLQPSRTILNQVNYFYQYLLQMSFFNTADRTSGTGNTYSPEQVPTAYSFLNVFDDSR